MQCYFSSIEDKFNFGRFCGWTLADVLSVNKSYLYWCINHHVFVGFSERAIDEIKTLLPSFVIGVDFANHICQIEEWPYQVMSLESSSFRDWRDDDSGDSCWDDAPTYDRYKGSYAQDEMGYSDDDIDTIFDGDPDAYWNID